jgi:hypothetical protein
MFFLKSAELVYMEQREHIPILKTLNGRVYSFQNLTKFSEGNNVLEATPSNSDGVHSRDICVS